MKSVENTRRELFEAWVKSQEKLNMQLHRFANLPIVYAGPTTATAWLAFNAALDSVVIELPKPVYPEFHEGDDQHNITLAQCLSAIESTNLGIKVK